MITIDGFHPHDCDAYATFSRDRAAQFFALVSDVARRLHVEVHGLQKIPRGRALIVGNHTFGWDPIFPMAAVWQSLHRPIFVLGEHLWWKFPFLRRMAASVGTVDGTPENVDRLLANDELVLVLPGGLRESLKPHALKYRLLWGHRYGFVRAAIRNQAPIVPLAALGADDLPRIPRLEFVFGDPIPMRVPAEAATEPSIVHSIRHEVEGELHELLETELAKRAGVYFD